MANKNERQDDRIENTTEVWYEPLCTSILTERGYIGFVFEISSNKGRITPISPYSGNIGESHTHTYLKDEINNPESYLLLKIGHSYGHESARKGHKQDIETLDGNLSEVNRLIKDRLERLKL